MSAEERDAMHCPHCGGELPAEEGDATALFCPRCGRRVEGWRTGFRASIGGANAPVAGNDDHATVAVAPSPALLRAAVATEAQKAAPQESPSSSTERVGPVKPRSSPLVLVGMIGGAAAFAIGALLVLGRPHRAPTKLVLPTPTVVPVAEIDAGVINAKTEVEGSSPMAAGQPAGDKRDSNAAQVLAEVDKKAAPKPAPPPLVKSTTPATKSIPKEPGAKAPAKVASGALPHKNARVDSKASDASAQPSGTSAAPMVPPPQSPPPLVGNTPEQPAQTPQQLAAAQRDEGAAQADATNVRYVVQKHIPQVQACYSRAFKDTSPGGRVDIGFVIGTNGRASKVRTEQNQTQSKVLSTCLEGLISSWQFVRPASGELELIYPFVFSPGT